MVDEYHVNQMSKKKKNIEKINMKGGGSKRRGMQSRIEERRKHEEEKKVEERSQINVSAAGRVSSPKVTQGHSA